MTNRIKSTIIAFAFLLIPALSAFAHYALNVTISATNNGVICAGNSVILTVNVSDGTAPFIYLWSTGENTSSITVNKAGTYTVIVFDVSGNLPVKESITVTSVSAPNMPTAPGVTICRGNQATLKATAPGGTYQWYDANGNFLATGDTYITPPINKNTFYYVESTIGSCTSARRYVPVNLSANPVATGASICAGNTAMVTATGGDSYTWYDLPGGNILGQGPAFTTPVLATTTTYYVVSVTNGCASAPIPAIVTVTPYPKTPVPAAASINLCPGSSANLHADASDGGTISWFDTPSGGTPLINSPDYTTPYLTATTTYYAQNSLGECTSPRIAVTVNVNPAPAAPTVTPVTTCAGTRATLTPVSASAVSFIWYADAGGTTPLPDNTANPFITPPLTATTTYYVQAVSNSCYSGLTPVTITVTDNLPAPTVAPIAQVCPNTTATLTATAPGGTYAWYDAASGGNMLFTGETFTPVVAANTTYYVQVANANGCVSSRTAVRVNVLPAATPPTAGPVTTCYNAPATLTASGSDNYQWFDAATGGTQLTSGQTFITDALTADRTYYVQTIVNGCTSARTPVNVTVTAIPQQPTVSGATTICPNTSATLTASVTDGGTIKWYNTATGGSVLASGNSYSPTVSSTTTYYAENNSGTCSSARVGVTVNTIAINFPQFSYATATLCKTAASITPTINDAAGGTFSALPAGLVFSDNTRGIIDVSGSIPNKYTITFVGNEACHSVTKATMSIVTSADATFSYSGPFCQFAATNPSPVFVAPASAGQFSASPAGLIFTDTSTGTIDLQKSNPGTYTVTNTIAASGACLQSVHTQTVIINPGVIINAGPDQTVKAGNTVQLAGIVTGTPGVKWSGGAGTFNDANIINPVYTPGNGETTATLTLSSTSGVTCGTTSDQVIITIAPKPASPTVADASTCQGSSATLSATTPGGTYEWFDRPTGGTKLFTGPNFVTPPLNANATYYVQTTISGNVSDRTAATVTINSMPLAPTAQGVSTCINTPATLRAQGSTGNYAWYATSSGGIPLSLTDTYVTPALTGNASYYVQAVNNGCESPLTKVDVTIIQPPVVTSASSGQVCSGSNLNYTITAAVAATFTWDRPAVPGISNAPGNGSTNVINEALINTTSSAVKVVYNITATANGCSSLFKYTVTIKPLGSVTSAANGVACNGVPVNYAFTFSHPSVTFRWSRAAVNGISNSPVANQAAPIVKETLFNTTNDPVDVTYTFNYTEGDCTGSFNYIVSVNPAISVTSPTDVNACSAVPFDYAITSNISSATFKWSRAAVSGISNAAVTDQPAPIIRETLVNTTSSIIYVPYYITPVAFGCQGTTFVLRAAVHPASKAPVINSNTPVCAGNAIFLQTPAVAGATYQWTGPDGFVSNNQNPVISNVSSANAGTYNLTVITNNCPGMAASATITVNAPPVVTVGPDQVVCSMQTAVDISGNISGGTTTGIWSTSGTGAFSPSAAQLNTQYIPSVQDKSNGRVVLTLTSTSRDDCTPAVASTQITFSATPSVNAGPDQQVCRQNKTIPLSGTLLKPGSATWSTSGSGLFMPSANQLDASYIPSEDDLLAGSVKLTLTYDNAGFCDVPTDDITITMIPPPTVYAGGTRYVVKGHTIVLEPTVSDDNVQYLWAPDSGLNNNTIKNPVVTGGDKDIIYKLTVTDVRGCTSADSAMVIVSPVITVNNTFTPNNDGVNDVWNILGLFAYTDATIDVYSRYGKLLYHSLGYPSPWNGTYNGKTLPSGTYYYVIKLNVNNQILSGPITIIR